MARLKTNEMEDLVDILSEQMEQQGRLLGIKVMRSNWISHIMLDVNICLNRWFGYLLSSMKQSK